MRVGTELITSAEADDSHTIVGFGGRDQFGPYLCFLTSRRYSSLYAILAHDHISSICIKNHQISLA
jgi:hypothetical protein